MSMSRSLLRGLRLAPLCAPLLFAACGVIIYDISNRALILEPVERIVFDSDHGGVEVYAFNRTAISLFFYLTGYETGIGDVGHSLNGDVLNAFILCEGDDLCNANFSAEVPLGTEVEVHAASGDVKLIGVDATVTAVVGAGAVDGVGLGSPIFELELATGDVTLEWASPPSQVQIAVATGSVTLTLPAGTYDCDFTAADGAVDNQGITCDPGSPARVSISVQSGDIVVQGAP